MSWIDRLKEAAYTAPSGIRYIFDFEDVSNSKEKKTTNFEFPDVDGTYVQESGSAGRSFPLRCIFSGTDYDLAADEFDRALFEIGIGKLEHPLYGTVDVVPTGTITRRDDLKTAANQAIFEVTFMSTIGIIYPSSQTDAASEVVVAVEEYNVAASGEFEEDVGLTGALSQAGFKSTYNTYLNQAQSFLQPIADTVDSVRSEFNAINSSINKGINVLIGQPLTLAFQTLQLIQAPARASSLISAKLSAYKNLAQNITTGGVASNKTDFQTKNLYAASYVSGMVLSTVNNQFSTRAEALGAATEVLNQFNLVNVWKDDNLTSLEIIDTGAAYQKLQKAVALTAGYLVEISFSLKQERRIVLDRARTIVDLVAELYEGVGPNLDFFIDSNDLSGSEILELPKGKTVAYYV